MVKKDIYDILETVKDPEIPVISIVDLGIVREVRRSNGKVEIDITPTYSGCPALDVIPVMIEEALRANGYENVLVKNILSPAWSTDWISENGLQKLKEYGIAPPVEKTSDKSFLKDEPKVVPCPQCTSNNTRLISQFGSTPCKAAYQCNDCMEPFDYFKCH
jgi:ring-1,2-phenylacetyl-CoA epoxidase subunit PaaD